MKLLFKQKFFSWFDSYDIYDENNQTYFTVKGKLAWGHLFQIYDKNGTNVGTLKERVWTWLPKFEMYENGKLVGEIKKEFTLIKPKFTLNCSSWQVDGNWIEWDYQITDNGTIVATMKKEIWNWTDTYSLDIVNESDALRVLMIVLAIDAVKCNQTAAAAATYHG